MCVLYSPSLNTALSSYHRIGSALKTSLLVFAIANALFNTNSVLDRVVIIEIYFNALNSVHDSITFTKELECGNLPAFLDVLI